MELKQALVELRKNKERKFDQTVDLIVNFKGIDLRKDNVNTVITVPHKFKEKKVCGFFNTRNKLVDTVTAPEFGKYSAQKELKNIVKKYDFFIAEAGLMPKVATTFGKALGPTGKMPSPQLGILLKVDDKSITDVLAKIDKSAKVRAKEACIKLGVGKLSMSDEQLMENVQAIYKGIENVLPNKKDNVKNVLIKTTMSKPIKLEIK